MTDLVTYTTARPDRTFDAGWLLDPAEIADRIGSTDFVPANLRGNVAAITAALLYGEEIRLGRMQSLAKISVINGRPTLAAEAMRALILAAGHELWFDEITVTRVTIAGRRRHSENTSRITWTMDDAKRAGLAGKGPYRLYPRQMLVARSSAELARLIFPDVIGGLQATEELDDYEVAAADQAPANGGQPADTKPPKAKTTRRRRTTATAPATTPDPPAPAEPEQPPVPGDDLPDFGDPPPPAEPAGDPMEEPQRRRLMALFRQKNITDHHDRLLYARAVTGRQLASSSELTGQEAAQLIASLDQYDPDDPQTWPFPEGF